MPYSFTNGVHTNSTVIRELCRCVVAHTHTAERTMAEHAISADKSDAGKFRARLRDCSGEKTSDRVVDPACETETGFELRVPQVVIVVMA